MAFKCLPLSLPGAVFDLEFIASLLAHCQLVCFLFLRLATTQPRKFKRELGEKLTVELKGGLQGREVLTGSRGSLSGGLKEVSGKLKGSRGFKGRG